MRTPLEQSEINKQKIVNAFPISMKKDVEIVFLFLLERKLDIHSNYEQEITLDGEKLIIPGRVYFDESINSSNSGLTKLQEIILNCICLRHNNGFVRQKNLECLIDETEYFLVPYVFQLLGEYVIEIIEIADRHVNENTIDSYLKFFKENPEYRRLAECRMISYWDVYYKRTYSKLSDYIGYKVFDRIKESEKEY